MTDATTIREAAPADWPAIWSIIAAVAAAGDSYMLDPNVSEAYARKYWTGESVDTYVAEVNGEIVGTYAMRANQHGLGSHVANAGYMIRPGYSGRGLGFTLGEHSIIEARAKGFQAMQFNAVVSTNTRAIALWKRLGFAIVGTVPKAFRHMSLGLVDIHIMHRSL